MQFHVTAEQIIAADAKVSYPFFVPFYTALFHLAKRMI